jgi:hypothetical protein
MCIFINKTARKRYKEGVPPTKQNQNKKVSKLEAQKKVKGARRKEKGTREKGKVRWKTEVGSRKFSALSS